ncbi:MAG: alpha/beta fold hydrolase [Bacteroidota bacterium]
MHRPVLLVPGFLDGPGSFFRLGRHLRSEGFDARALRLSPRLATCSLHDFARQVAAEVEATRQASGVETVDLVGFSMGGLVSRLYVQRHGGAERVRRLITLASPHAGSHVARIMPQQATREMRPGSDLLTDLDRDIEMLEEVDVASLWTPYDLTVLPGSSGALSVGTSEAIPVKLHRLMLLDRRVFERVSELLRDEG